MASAKKVARKKMTIEFCHDSNLNYHWWLKDKTGGTVGGAGGFESMVELLTDPAFLEAIAAKFGDAAMPPGLVQMSVDRLKSRMLPFPDDIVAKLAKAMPGVPIIDAREKRAKAATKNPATKRVTAKKAT